MSCHDITINKKRNDNLNLACHEMGPAVDRRAITPVRTGPAVGPAQVTLLKGSMPGLKSGRRKSEH